METDAQMKPFMFISTLQYKHMDILEHMKSLSLKKHLIRFFFFFHIIQEQTHNDLVHVEVIN